MNDLQKAKGLLTENTCVLCKEDRLYTSQKTGIAPMLDWLAEGADLSGYSVADKIVGKAAALLFILAAVKDVYGEVMSEGGLAVLQSHGIPCSYGTLAPYIINRKGDGICPMEQTVQDIDDPESAYEALWETRKKLQNKH